MNFFQKKDQMDPQRRTLEMNLFLEKEMISQINQKNPYNKWKKFVIMKMISKY